MRFLKMCYTRIGGGCHRFTAKFDDENPLISGFFIFWFNSFCQLLSAGLLSDTV